MESLFTAVIKERTYILGITPDYLIVQIAVNIPEISQVSPPSPTSILSSPPITEASLELASVTKLPLGDHEYPNLKFIIPVDPMGWTDLYHTRATISNRAQVDALLSVNEDGELAFWAPEDHLLLPSSRSDSGSKAAVEVNPIPKPNQSLWRRTGTVRTRRKGLRIVACSSTKKSVLGTYRCRPLTLIRLTYMTSGTPRRGRRIDDLGFEGERVRKWARVRESVRVSDASVRHPLDPL